LSREINTSTGALVPDAFAKVIARGGSGVVIASQSGHRLPALPAEQNKALATTPVEELLSLPFLAPGQVKDTLHAYQLLKRGNVLRVAAEAVRWGKRGARINAISPGIIMTPLARDELTGPRGEGYRRMIEVSAAGRAGTPDEIANVAERDAELAFLQAEIYRGEIDLLVRRIDAHDRFSDRC